jgi:hypothetical protein
MINRWTDHELMILREKALAGFTAREIGTLLDRSKNSIIGKCHHTGIQLQRTKAKMRRPASNRARAAT